MSRRSVFLLCLCYLIFAEGLSWITVSWPGCLVQEKNQQEASNQTDQKNCATFLAGMVIVAGRAVDVIKRDDNDKAIVAAFTIVLALSTIGLWTATLRLWGAARDTAEQQSKDTEIIQRAYISVEPGGISPHIYGSTDEVQKHVGHVRIRNAGRLPAREVKWFVKAATDTNGDCETFPFGFLEGGNVLSPETVMSQGSNAVAIPTHRQVYIYVWGSVHYHDGFGPTRRTNFCHRYNSKRLRDGTGSIRPRYGRHHHHGNDAT